VVKKIDGRGPGVSQSPADGAPGDPGDPGDRGETDAGPGRAGGAAAGTGANHGADHEADHEADDGAPASSSRRRGGLVRELVVIVVTALLISSLVKGYAVQTFSIPSGSMEQTLHGCPGCHGDRVLVNKFVYRTRDVRRGEVVVFQGTANWPDEGQGGAGGPLLALLDGIGRLLGAPPTGDDFIKRVIAVGGDTVECCDAQGRVTVNAVPLTEPYVYQDDHQKFGPVTVRPGELWVMGDHRGDSSDSRAHGAVPAKNVVGRAFVVVWPFNRWKSLPVPKTFGADTLNRA
jgi:signal peptidase I